MDTAGDEAGAAPALVAPRLVIADSAGRYGIALSGLRFVAGNNKATGTTGMEPD